MPYFRYSIAPPGQGRDAEILVTEFHKDWKRAAQQIMGAPAKRIIEQTAINMSKWADMPISLDWHEEYGLTHIVWSGVRVGIDLIEPQSHNPRYQGHNVGRIIPAFALSGVLMEYTNMLRDLTED